MSSPPGQNPFFVQPVHPWTNIWAWTTQSIDFKGVHPWTDNWTKPHLVQLSTPSPSLEGKGTGQRSGQRKDLTFRWVWRLGSRAGRPLVANERKMLMEKKIGRATFDVLIFKSPTRTRTRVPSLSVRRRPNMEESNLNETREPTFAHQYARTRARPMTARAPPPSRRTPSGTTPKLRTNRRMSNE